MYCIYTFFFSCRRETCCFVSFQLESRFKDTYFGGSALFVDVRPATAPPPRVFSGWNGIQAASGVRDPTRIRESVNRFLQKHQPEFRGEGYLLAFVGELFVGYGRMPIYPFTSSVAPQAYKNSISSHKLGGFSCTCLSVCFAVVGVLIIVLGLYRGADCIWKI